MSPVNNNLVPNQQGQALVEMAFILPVLILILFGFLQLGFLIHTQQKLTYLANYSAQIGAQTNDDSKIMGALENEDSSLILQLQIKSFAKSNQASISSSQRRYGDTLTIILEKNVALIHSVFPTSVFTVQAKASARILCHENQSPYTCE